MRNKTKRIVYALALSLVIGALLGLVACDRGCEHQWQEATCKAPRTCKLCSATEGAPLAHTGGTATCTEKATCSVCGEAYGEIAEHAWVDATCTQPKHCENCSATEGDATGHTGGTATCTEKATCSACGEAYGDLLAHTFDQVKATEAALKTAATCQSAAVYYKSCVCGAVSSNEADVFTNGDVAAHSFSKTWDRNDTQHWHACACGEKADVAGHAYENVTVNREPTCVNAGESTATCVCGATKVSTIPATGEHTYVDGTCSGCGLQEAVCDHSVFHEESLELATHGACLGFLYYESCDCGEVLRFDIYNDMNLTCEFDMEETESKDELGNEVSELHLVCSKCGLCIDGVETFGTSGCIEFERGIYTIIMNGHTLVEGLSHEYTEVVHEDGDPVEIDLAQYGACGGILKVWKCIHCGVDLDYDVVMEGFLCPVDPETDPEPEEVVDEQGNTHYVYSIGCSECGFAITLDEWVEEISYCEETLHEVMTISVGNTVIFNTVYEQSSVEHEYEYEFELLGETCMDGVRITATCDDCGTSLLRVYNDHLPMYNYTYLAEWGCCPTYVEEATCIACKELLGCTKREYCSWQETGTTDEGYTIYSCSFCGLTKHSSVTKSEKDESCQYTQVEDFIFFIDGQEIYSGHEERIFIDHTLGDPTYQLHGDTCDDGYTITQVCIHCGRTFEWEESWHDSDYRSIDLEALGLCGGYIEEEYCTICESILDFEFNSYCEWALIDEEEGLYECTSCGAIVREYEIIGEPNESCEVECFYVFGISLNGEELYYYEEAFITAEHEYECSYEMHGATCEDGYTVTEICTRCGASNKWNSSGHDTDYRSIDLEALGLCGGYIDEAYCTICNTVEDFYYDIYCSLHDIDGEEDMYECDTCGVIVRQQIIAGEPNENCEVEVNHVFVLYMNGEELYHLEETYMDTEHDLEYSYELHGATCEDGYTATMTCTRCDYVYTWEANRHDTDYRSIDLETLGLCGGYIEEAYCTICHTLEDFYYNIDCALRIVDGEEGMYECPDCGVMVYVHDTVGEPDENCEVEILSVLGLYMNGEELYYQERAGISIKHDWKYTYELHGATCDDGYTVFETCTHCGASDDWEDTWHDYNWYVEDVNRFGICSGSISVCRCDICGEYDIYDFYSICDWVYLGTTEDGCDSYRCEECGIVKVESYEDGFALYFFRDDELILVV